MLVQSENNLAFPELTTIEKKIKPLINPPESVAQQKHRFAELMDTLTKAKGLGIVKSVLWGQNLEQYEKFPKSKLNTITYDSEK